MTDPILRTEGLTKTSTAWWQRTTWASAFRAANCVASSVRMAPENPRSFPCCAASTSPTPVAYLLKDEDVTRLLAFRRVRRGIGLTFQTNRTFHRLSVRQNLKRRPADHQSRPAGRC